MCYTFSVKVPMELIEKAMKYNINIDKVVKIAIVEAIKKHEREILLKNIIEVKEAFKKLDMSTEKIVKIVRQAREER